MTGEQQDVLDSKVLLCIKTISLLTSDLALISEAASRLLCAGEKLDKVAKRMDRANSSISTILDQ